MIFRIFWIYFMIFTCSQVAISKENDSITIYVFLLDECRISQEVAPELNRLHDEAKKEGLGFIGLFPNYASTQEGIQRFVKKYHLSFPVQEDYQKKLAKKLGASIMPEVVVYNESQKQIIYKGLINNLFYAPGKRRHRITQHYLKDVIFAIQQGTTPTISQTEAIGCFINFSENPF